MKNHGIVFACGIVATCIMMFFIVTILYGECQRRRPQKNVQHEYVGQIMRIDYIVSGGMVLVQQL